MNGEGGLEFERKGARADTGVGYRPVQQEIRREIDTVKLKTVTKKRGIKSRWHAAEYGVRGSSLLLLVSTPVMHGRFIKNLIHRYLC